MKKIITVLSDAPFIPTGYRNQAIQLIQHLENDGHEIHYLANAYIGATMNGIELTDGTKIKAKIYGSAYGQDYFRNQLSQHLKETKSDILIILLDTFMLYPWLLELDLSPAKTYFWFPSDGGGGMPKGCENILKKVDCPVAMSKFGQKQVFDYYQIKADYIPHGIDKKRFFRLPDKERNELRARWGFNDKFVIGVVARNQPRKFLDRTFKIMRIIKEKIPHAVLFLHLDPNDAAQSFNMASVIQKYGLENRVIFSGMQAHKGFDWNKMNEIYNLMDVFLLTTSGEGFGIPIIEAMSCEVPVLMTDYTTCQELVKDNQSGIGIDLSGVETINWNDINLQEADIKSINGTIMGSWEVERGCCSITDGAEKIIKLYLNQNTIKELGKNGRIAVEREYDFGKVYEKWKKTLFI
jgi:glycosyltransferase involved in cell wall biosynthesis